jgi:quinoprotein glucose dehydrogenase
MRAQSLFRAWAAPVLGVSMFIIGAVLAAGGGWLLALHGSPYYLVAGLALIASGVLLMLRRAEGALLYLVVFIATLAWAWWEVGTNGWALVPRIVGPAVLMLLTILVTPALLSYRRGYGATFAAASVCSLCATVALFVLPHTGEANAATSLPASAAPLSMGDSSLLHAGADWPAYGGSDSARRYSPLTQINRDNVRSLERAWDFHTGDLPTSSTKGTYGSENTPLKIHDTLYVCTPKNIIVALDAATGKQRWRFDPQVPDESIPYTAACRGVSYFAVPDADPTKPCAERIVEGTLDARLIEVDSRTGQRCQAFAHGGEVDTAIGIGQHDPGMYSITSAPTIIRGIIVTGHQVLDGQKRDAPSGVILGYDASTGELKWSWDMVKPDGTPMPQLGETYTRGTPNMWTTASGDQQLGLVYLPLGISAVDYWSGTRSKPEKEFGTSLVAIDVTTGKVAWHFQTVHNDVWDYDLGSQATLVDFPTAQGPVPAIVLPSKRGDIFVLDRKTGQPLVGVEERTVPQGGVEPEQRSKTQPFSLYHTLAKPDLTERDMWGMSPIDQLICRIQFKRAKYEGIFTPPTAEPRYIEYPGYNGGSDWGGISVDPSRGVIVANYNDMPNFNRLVPREEANKMGWTPRDQTRGRIGGVEGAGDPQAGAPYAINVNAGWRLPGTGLLCKQPPYGGIRAVDLKTGKTLWDRPFGQARTNGPFGIPSMLPITIGTPNNGGSIITAGGLIFVAAATDNLIRAIDIETGKLVWQDKLPAGGQATPMTYEENGKQYLVIMAGGHHFMETPVGDEVVAYALPSK